MSYKYTAHSAALDLTTSPAIHYEEYSSLLVSTQRLPQLSAGQRKHIIIKEKHKLISGQKLNCAKILIHNLSTFKKINVLDPFCK